jgi:carbamoyl-phosphate synthase large subunit
MRTNPARSAACRKCCGGSIVGQGIIKALRHSKLPLRLVCTDIAPLHAGLLRADEARVLPPVEMPGALDAWLAAIRELRADVLMIGSEYDLAFFSKHRAAIEGETGCKVIASPPGTVAIADDKLATAEFLNRKRLPYARAIAPASPAEALAWAEESGYPFVLKSRSGTSARHVHVIRDPESLVYFFPRTPRPMVQEFLQEVSGGIGGEFTCSTFRCADGALLGPFVSRRTLRGGSSWMVEIVDEPAVAELMLAVGERLASVGSLNVQLMLTARGPVPFEFNARFSGTTPIRAYFGFNEPEMAIRSYVLNERLASPRPHRGFCLRYVEEIMLDAMPADTIPASLPAGVINRWF